LSSGVQALGFRGRV
jgi:hypothetical protein